MLSGRCHQAFLPAAAAITSRALRTNHWPRTSRKPPVPRHFPGNAVRQSHGDALKLPKRSQCLFVRKQRQGPPAQAPGGRFRPVGPALLRNSSPARGWPARAAQNEQVYVTGVVRPSGRRILPCDVRWSTRTKCASAPNRRSQSAMGRAAGFAWCRPTPSWWTPFAQCHTVAQATKFSRGAAASDCPPGPRSGGPQRGSRKRDCRRPLREPASKGQPATGCSPA